MNVASHSEAPEMTQGQTWVIPFYRASCGITLGDRTLFQRQHSPDTFLEQLNQADPILRQNIRRIFAACLLAERENAFLVLVEGWQSNAIQRQDTCKKVTGSYMGKLIVKLLKRQGFVSTHIKIIRQPQSCCTWEEIDAVDTIRREHAPDNCKIIAVTDNPCPSASRLKHYVSLKRLEHFTTATPKDVFETIKLSAHQQSLVNTLQPHPNKDHWQTLLTEAPNWLLHILSYLSAFLFPKDYPLERWLARKLRK